MIDMNGGAKSQGGTSGNRVNGISDKNPNRQRYLDEAERKFGKRGLKTNLEKLLSLDLGALGTSPVRVDILYPKGLRMPDGNEIGANSQWVLGGFTGGGIPEQ